MDLETQIIDLQTRLAYQEDTISSLSETVASQDQDIAQLKNRCRFLQERFSEMKNEPQGQPSSDERPPHY